MKINFIIIGFLVLTLWSCKNNGSTIATKKLLEDSLMNDYSNRLLVAFYKAEAEHIVFNEVIDTLVVPEDFYIDIWETSNSDRDSKELAQGTKLIFVERISESVAKIQALNSSGDYKTGYTLYSSLLKIQNPYLEMQKTAYYDGLHKEISQLKKETCDKFRISEDSLNTLIHSKVWLP